jgi:hypothetical protein
MAAALSPLVAASGGCGGRILLAAFLAASLLASAANAAVSYDHRSLVINGRRRILISGSIHYPRSTPEVPARAHGRLLPTPASCTQMQLAPAALCSLRNQKPPLASLN